MKEFYNEVQAIKEDRRAEVESAEAKAVEAELVEIKKRVLEWFNTHAATDTATHIDVVLNNRSLAGRVMKELCGAGFKTSSSGYGMFRLYF